MDRRRRPAAFSSGAPAHRRREGLQPPRLKLCRLCNSDSLNSGPLPTPVDAFELMMPLKMVTAAEVDEEDDDEDPVTVSGVALDSGLL